MKQGQDLGCATPDILVRPDCRVALRPPTAARVRHSLERTSLVLAPDRQPKLRAERVSLLDQRLCSDASGSTRVTVPCLRRRVATPVWHQVRLFCPAQAGLVECAPYRKGANLW